MLNFIKNYLFISYTIVLLSSVYKSSIYRTILLKKGLSADNLIFQLLFLKLNTEESYNVDKNIKIKDYDDQIFNQNKKKNIYYSLNYQPIMEDKNNWEFKFANKIEINHSLSKNGLGYFNNIFIKNSILDFRKNINIFSEAPIKVDKQKKYFYQELPIKNYKTFINNENLYFMPLFCYATYEMENNGYFNGFDLHLKESGLYIKNSVIQIFDFYLDEKKFPFSNLDTDLTVRKHHDHLSFNIIVKPNENLRNIGFLMNMTNHIKIDKFNFLIKADSFWNKNINIKHSSYFKNNYFIKTDNSESSNISYKIGEKFRIYCQILINDLPVNSRNYEIKIEENRNYVQPCANLNIYESVLFCNIKNDPKLELSTFNKFKRKYMLININFTCN